MKWTIVDLLNLEVVVELPAIGRDVCDLEKLQDGSFGSTHSSIRQPAQPPEVDLLSYSLTNPFLAVREPIGSRSKQWNVSP
jgi:hypothetical protein